ncbi:CPBP family intramembrane metalloprotease domain-containing protein [Amycolatopsis antarctica]|uniref:CPBP family intramembrane metalloprotease domain-containing protein n=1 Tax=Amycolatopsis antarctica TaxID=1854586 RepID=A0A263CZH5_9PSEU|nr:CPBP family intramembrane glutamic endopeptidase [Amycolatopsis antarctica]OZM71573.1 CPBP family intramembrane metalloprotease domain-containing protein [Amycolatopsis antarctica]
MEAGSIGRSWESVMLNPYRSVRWSEIRLFAVLAYVGAWVVMTPIWLSGFRRTDAADTGGLDVQVFLWAMMLTPALAAAAVLLRGGRRLRDLPGELGLRLPGTLRQTLVSCAKAFVLTTALIVLSAVLASAFGVFEFDLHGFSGLREETGAGPGTGPPLLPALGWIAAHLLTSVLFLPLFLGEEIGWQGYLLPRLLPLGTPRALLVMGVLWALWHLPTVLLGGQFPGYGMVIAVPAAVIGGVLVGVFIGWIRLRTGSVWPTVTAHTVISHVMPPLMLAMGDAERTPDPLQAGLLGWTGWIVLGGMAVVLAATGQLRRRRSRESPIG